MGNQLSESQIREREQQQLEDFVMATGAGPDLRVSQDVVKFCSISSSEELKQHYERRKKGGDHGLGWIKTLMEKLGDLTPSPALAGLGALAIAALIDTVSCRPEDSTVGALRSVFAEQKASEVWDQIDECLKRCTVNINNQHELVNDLKRIDNQLSLALTRLKNSMLRDRQMSSPALRAWVNGAAFHAQMLIHLVRLGGIPTCDPVKKLLTVYEEDLNPLFQTHREVITSSCEMKAVVGEYLDYFYLVDEESNSHPLGVSHSSFDKYVECYYNHRYWGQKSDIQQQFREVRQNLQSLVRQAGSFRIS